MPPKPDATQKQIISELLATDADLRAIAREFVARGLADLVALQKRGDPKIREAIARSLAQPIIAAITEATDEDSHAELRAEMQEMMAEMMGTFVPPGEATHGDLTPESTDDDPAST